MLDPVTGIQTKITGFIRLIENIRDVGNEPIVEEPAIKEDDILKKRPHENVTAEDGAPASKTMKNA